MMGDTYIGKMYNAVEEFVEELRWFAKKQKITISIDTLIHADEVYWRDEKAVTLEKYEWSPPHVGGKYDHSKLFSALLNRITEYENDEYAPIIYLFYGKRSPDLNNKQYKTIKSNTIYQKCIKNSVCLKEVTNFLKDFATSANNILLDITPEGLKKGLLLNYLRPCTAQITESDHTTSLSESSSLDDILKINYNKTKELEQKISNLQSIYNDSKNQYLELLNKYNNLNSELCTYKTNEQSLKSQLNELGGMRKDLTSLKIDYNKLNKEFKKINEVNQALEELNKSLNQDITLTKSENIKTKEELKKSKAQNNVIHTSNTLLASNNAQLKTELDNLKAQKMHIQDDNNILRSQISKLENELSTTRNNYQKLEVINRQTINTIKIRNVILNDAINSSLTKQDELQKKNNELRNNINVQQKMICQLENTNTDYLSRLNSRCREVKMLQICTYILFGFLFFFIIILYHISNTPS